RWGRVLEGYAGEWGLDVEIFQEARAALERCDEQGAASFDVAILATPLRELATGEFVEQLRQTAHGAALPLLALTRLGMPALPAELEAEIPVQVHKPVRSRELL